MFLFFCFVFIILEVLKNHRDLSKYARKVFLAEALIQEHGEANASTKKLYPGGNVMVYARAATSTECLHLHYFHETFAIYSRLWGLY